VFFTQALVLSTFFGVADDLVPLYIIPFALGNLLGPLLLGRLFDSVGRRPMITLCYVLSGGLLIGTGLLFNAQVLSATTLTACWVVVFLFASAGASAAYLTGKLVETEKEINVFYGYLIGAVLMIAAGIAEWFIGVKAAGKSLEDVARPLTADETEGAGAPA
jgi:MFS family permease